MKGDGSAASFLLRSFFLRLPSERELQKPILELLVAIDEQERAARKDLTNMCTCRTCIYDGVIYLPTLSRRHNATRLALDS